MREPYPSPEVIRNLKRRASIIRAVRKFLDDRGYTEVETPARTFAPDPQPNIDPIPSDEKWLVTSPEFHCKRLLAAGLERLYTIGKCWRGHERTDRHNPEFTMLEFYATGMTVSELEQEVERLILFIAKELGTGHILDHPSLGQIDLTTPWKRVSVRDAFIEHAGYDPLENRDEDRFYFDLVDKVEMNLGRERPTVLNQYPADLAMLARLDENDPRVAERFEVYIGPGFELANGFGELTDPQLQRERFEEDLARRRKAGQPVFPLDERFLNALIDMPESSGVAIGIDRLVMLFCGASTIDQVIAFPDELA
jgi:elongation factor P--(R)-beta-lysine ligase